MWKGFFERITAFLNSSDPCFCGGDLSTSEGGVDVIVVNNIVLLPLSPAWSIQKLRTSPFPLHRTDLSHTSWKKIPTRLACKFRSSRKKKFKITKSKNPNSWAVYLQVPECGEFSSHNPKCTTTALGANRAPTQEPEQGRQLVSSSSLAAQSLGCRVPGSKESKTSPVQLLWMWPHLQRLARLCGMHQRVFSICGQEALQRKGGREGSAGHFFSVEFGGVKNCQEQAKNREG